MQDTSSALIIPRVRYELPGGGILLVSRRPSAPVTAVRIHMRGGLLADPNGREGLSQWMGQLTDQGTAEHDEAGIAERIEPWGGAVGGDSTGLHGSMAGDNWRQLLDVMVELTSRPAYPDEAVKIQMARTLSQMKVQEEDPRVQGARSFRRLIYGSHRFGQPGQGTLKSLEGITPQDLRDHHKTHWGSARAVIAVCGNVDPDAVYERMLVLLKDWHTGTPEPEWDREFPEREVRAEAFEKGREQVHVYYGHLGVERKVADYPALVVMDHVLGSGPGFVSRLSKKLRDEQGLAYSVHADIHSSAGLYPGMFTAYIGTSPEHVERAVQGIQAEVRDIRDVPVSEDELVMARDYVTGSMVLGYERASSRAGSLVGQELHGFPEDHLETLRSAYHKVTVKDVQETAQRNLHPDASVLAASGSITTETLRGLMGL
ncbi:MAG: insulinase family protein [Planctomycetes bacterium]|nr:insulinase family protein [Planctomycetota bacterium]